MVSRFVHRGLIIAVLGASVGLSACAGFGREPDLLKVHQRSDVDKSCIQLRTEIYEHHLRSGDQTRRAITTERRNVYLGVAIPFSLSIDFTGRERRNARQHRLRRDHLKALFDKYRCVGYVGF